MTDEEKACVLFGHMPQPKIDEADSQSKERGVAGLVFICQRCGKPL